MSFTGTVEASANRGHKYEVSYREGHAVRCVSVGHAGTRRVLWNEHVTKPMTTTVACAIRAANRKLNPTALDKALASAPGERGCVICGKQECRGHRP